MKCQWCGDNHGDDCPKALSEDEIDERLDRSAHSAASALITLSLTMDATSVAMRKLGATIREYQRVSEVDELNSLWNC